MVTVLRLQAIQIPSPQGFNRVPTHPHSSIVCYCAYIPPLALLISNFAYTSIASSHASLQLVLWGIACQLDQFSTLSVGPNILLALNIIAVLLRSSSTDPLVLICIFGYSLLSGFIISNYLL
ncbi:hypothetical protein MAP00_003733 [Monascus purpureus]|nr:hypothetical protein MAP00_003733 [Monascus purpureus]